MQRFKPWVDEDFANDLALESADIREVVQGLINELANAVEPDGENWRWIDPPPVCLGEIGDAQGRVRVWYQVDERENTVHVMGYSVER
ncbi:MAG: hypothetical protein OXG19_02745 [Chloroflexi bacterium]|nr:hypothetical protein [Chloroflexota bacterium]